MTFQFGGTQANVTITGGISQSIPVPSATQTIINKHALQVANGTVLHTVTAGKTFYCTGYSIGTDTGNVTVQIQSDGVKVAQKFFNATIVNPSAEAGGGIIFTTAATKTVTVTGAGGTSNIASIWGFEE